MKIRKLDSTEISDALNLALRVFLEFEGPVYSAEGIETFCRFLRNPEAVGGLTFYGAFAAERIVGLWRYAAKVILHCSLWRDHASDRGLEARSSMPF